MLIDKLEDILIEIKDCFVKVFITEKEDTVSTIKNIFLYIGIGILSIIVGGGTAGCYMMLALLGPIPFLLMIAFELILIIMVLLYYIYPEEVWEVDNEIKESCRRGLRKLQNAINVSNHNKM